MRKFDEQGWKDFLSEGEVETHQSWTVEWFPATSDRRAIEKFTSAEEAMRFIQGENLLDAEDLTIYDPSGQEVDVLGESELGGGSLSEINGKEQYYLKQQNRAKGAAMALLDASEEFAKMPSHEPASSVSKFVGTQANIIVDAMVALERFITDSGPDLDGPEGLAEANIHYLGLREQLEDYISEEIARWHDSAKVSLRKEVEAVGFDLTDAVMQSLGGEQLKEFFGKKKKKPDLHGGSHADILDNAVKVMTQRTESFPEGNGLNYVIWGPFDDPFDSELKKLGQAFTARLKQVAAEVRERENSSATQEQEAPATRYEDLTKEQLDGVVAHIKESRKKQ